MKKVVSGFLFGIGFSVACIILYSVWLHWIWPMQMEKLTSKVSAEVTGTFSKNTKIVDKPPKISNEVEFLGHSGTYGEKFSTQGASVLSPGNSKITGSATLSDKPIGGVKIRLAINGSAYSQWATTQRNGSYEISAPEGEYRIDGFEIDKRVADKVLPGKIFQPNMGHRSNIMNISPSQPGHGLNFHFVDPVVLKLPKGKASLSGDVYAEWEPFPGAEKYEVQLYESDDFDGYAGFRTIFDWKDRPETTNTKINLKAYNADLKIGKYYSVHITAKDVRGKGISETPSTMRTKDFQIVE